MKPESDSDFDFDDCASTASEISWPDTFFVKEREGDHQPRSYPDVPFDNTREIRVLGLQPGNLEDEIHCQLAATALLDPDSDLSMGCAYEALSYVWGPWDDAKEIRFVGCSKPFPVTHNLWCALRRLRHPHNIRWLWIDQLCINQDLLVERNHQVQLMGKIYSHAHHVIIWLGDVTWDDRNDLGPILTPELHDPQKGLVNVMNAVRSMSNKWWERIWVVQEVANARKDPSFAFGPFEMPWTWLIGPNANTGISFSYHNQAHPKQLKLVTEELVLAAQMYRELAGAKTELRSMAQLIARTQATNERDKVYALLGLIDPRQRALIRPDYSQAVCEVYAEATMASLLFTESFQVLQYVVLPENSTDPNTYPSWVWHFGYRAPGYDRRTVAWNKHQYNSPGPFTWELGDAGGWTALNAAKFSAQPRGIRHICFKGLRFDAILTDVPGQLFPAEQRSFATEYWPYVYLHTRDGFYEEALKPFADCYDHLTIARPHHIIARTLELFSTRNRDDHSFLWNTRYSACVLFHCWRRQQATKTGPRRTWKSLFDDDVSLLDGRLEDSDASGARREILSSLDQWIEYFKYASECAKPFITNAGFPAITASTALAGDVVVLPHGCSYPMLLRDAGDGTWKFQGFAYVHGIMEGELKEIRPDLELPEEQFILS